MTLQALIPWHVKSVTRRNLVRFRASGLRYMEKQKRLAEEAKKQNQTFPVKSNQSDKQNHHIEATRDENQNSK